MMATDRKVFAVSSALPWVLTLVLGVAAWTYWRVGYPHVMAYEEQFQLFLFGGRYFMERLSLPGGLACWTGELLTQFYNNAMAGALVLALLYMLLQRLTWRLMAARTPALYPLNFLPVVLLWYAMGDENVLLAYAVALAVTVACCLLLRRGGRVALTLAAVIGLPLLYWLIGPVALMVAVYMMLVLPFRRPTGRLTTAAIGLLGVVATVAMLVAAPHLVPYPLNRIAVGLFYYRFPAVLPLMFVVVPVVTLVLAAVGRLAVKPARTVLAASVSLAFVVLTAVWLLPRAVDAKKSELMDYDFLVRTAQWQAIVSKAERQQPDLPMSVAATNLALAMQSQLGDRAFLFYQRGTQGLVPPFERNFATALTTGEIYFRLGLVNTAQRFAFEAMEALPNYAKSVRVMKRLAEVNLINGQYDVARKYLLLLRKTLFYRRWATQTLALLGHEDQINAHPLYGWLREVRLDDDFLFSEDEVDKMCGQLFVHNPRNAMAMQYLLMWPLLRGDLATFTQYLQVVHQHRAGYTPRYVQEAMGIVANPEGARRQQPQRGTLLYYLLNGQ